ncbi:MAG: HupE/UreJ family protein [Gemmatimonadaceae bacterium]|nr:HupE/UreJ family protein [Gemmatimonadaceae bacterium]MCW5827656.1 HupE/UreJ family protein [Gemmatimonadaceae bacterium]
MHQRRLLLLASLLLATTMPRALDSHEIPERVALRAWVVPRDTTLTLLLRVPLEAMRDLDFPERADGRLDMVRVRALLPEAARLWLAEAVELSADGVPTPAARVRATRLALPDDRSFESLASAEASFAAPELGDTLAIPWRQAHFDVRLEFSIPREDARLALRPALARLGVRTSSVLHLVLPDGRVRTLRYTGDPGVVTLDPRWWQSAGQFLAEGFWHILGGLDHLLFVICLVLPVRRWRPLVAVVTAFTVAHSITLGAAALGAIPTALWFPPLVETAIAASILWLCVENVLLDEARLERRWRMAFGFGLIHGFGFSFALQEQLQYAGGNLLTALAAFNIGVELGQVLVLSVALVALTALRRKLPVERGHLVTWVGSALVAHSAWHWMAERWEELAAHELTLALPALDASFLLYAMRVALLGAVALAAALALRPLILRLTRP